MAGQPGKKEESIDEGKIKRVMGIWARRRAGEKSDRGGEEPKLLERR